MDPQLKNPQTPGAQVLRLDSPTGAWVEDQDFDEVNPSTGKKDYMAIAGLATAHFDRDFGNNPIRPVDVLMAGFWNYSSNGLSVWKKPSRPALSEEGDADKEPACVAAKRLPGRAWKPLLRVLHEFCHSRGAGLRRLRPIRHLLGRLRFGQQHHRVGRNTGSRRDGKRRARVMGFAACGGKFYAWMHRAILRPHRRGKSQLA